ncbi:MAG TPA: hypothetical protein VMT15_17505 [Bryobacteraceae bacterium]|nr:hypothetical protein [Bryobacteraceae bacterium]
MRRANPDSAFLNIPYDRSYEELFLAYIAGLAAFGIQPRATLELTAGARRLDRIFHLISSCDCSFHDLSMVKLDRKAPRTPRFNMPFELGLVIGWQRATQSNHRWFVFESSPYRVQKSLSDLNGTDPFIYNGTPDGVLREVRNCLARRRDQPTADQMHRIFRDLRDTSVRIRKDAAASSLFEARVFANLSVGAGQLAARVLPGLKA